MREIKSITGLRVISVDEGANVGTVSQVVVDLASGEVLGIILGNGAAERGVPAADIQTIGSDVIMISRREVARHLSELPDLERRRSAGGHLVPVFTDRGRRLGVVSGIYIDPLEKVVTRYEVSSGALKDLAEGLLVLPIISGTVHGQDAVILPESAVGEVGRETGGLLARFSQWGDSARKQYQQVADSAEKMVGSGAETLRKEAAVARERAAGVAEGLSSKAEDLSVKARAAVKNLGQKEDETTAEAPAAVEAEAADNLVAVPAEGTAADDIIAAPAHDPAAEAIVAADEPAEEQPAEQATPACDDDGRES